jgi:hypothetical protein
MKAFGNGSWTWTEQTRSAKIRASGEAKGIDKDGLLVVYVIVQTLAR